MKMTEEEYLLTCLVEECAEVIQRVQKSQRFGLEEVQQSNPIEQRTNRQRIAYEMQDLVAIIQLLREAHTDTNNDYCLMQVDDHGNYVDKKDKLLKYMNYSKTLGTVE